MFIRNVILVAIAAAGLWTTDAHACTVTATRVERDPDGTINGPITRQRQRERFEAERRAYGEARARDVDARAAHAATDLAFDLTRMLMPNVVQPVGYLEAPCNGPLTDAVDADATGILPIEDFARRIGLAVAGGNGNDVLIDHARHRETCNDEYRRGLAAYLRTAIPAAQMRDVWRFLAPRVGGELPSDGAQPIADARITALQTGTGTIVPLRIYDGRMDYIGARRERAAQFLANHPDGQAVMRAVNAYTASNLGDPRGVAVWCPMVAASAPAEVLDDRPAG
jgi:hypothetical protein